jgi:glutamate/tyrosine decarboxylase-like PLP-dependent enzyme
VLITVQTDAGAYMLCDEFRGLFSGIHLVRLCHTCGLPSHNRHSQADSFAVNAHKKLLTSFDCCCMFFRNRQIIMNSLIMKPAYLRFE